MNELERRLVAAHGVLRRADHRDLSGTLDRALRDGRLHGLYPGVYVVPDQADLVPVRIRAAAAWAGPDAVLTGWAATLDQLWEAFAATPSRPGNARRRRLLVESRTSPWSEAERELHRLFHRAGVRGWRANVAVLGYFVDVLFATEMVVVEVDGWETHGSRAAFEADRERRNALELAGYLVLNFTWRHISERPEWVLHCIEEARRRRREGSIR